MITDLYGMHTLKVKGVTEGVTDWTRLDWNPKICFYAQRHAIKR